MEMRVHRALVPAFLAAALLLLLGWHAVPARAVSIDPELVAESVSEDGYYVDSSAPYLKSDADLDKLREAIENAGRAGVVVLPAGVATGPVITRLLHEPNRRATYVVLSGDRMQAVSNSIPSAKVSGLVAKARRAGSPKMEVITFLDLLGGKHPAAASGKQQSGNLPDTSSSSGGGDAGATSTAPVAAKQDSGGGNGTLYGVVGAAIVLLLGGGGFFFWRRRRQDTPGAPGPGPGSGPGGGSGPGAPGPGPGPESAG